MDRCHHCGDEVPPEQARRRVVLGQPDQPGDFYVFSKNKKRMSRVGKPKGPGVVGPRPFCPHCAAFLDKLLEKDHARLKAKQGWALLAGAIIVALLVAAAVAVALR